MVNKLPTGITKRGSSYRVSIMVSGVRRTVTCVSLTDAVQRAENIRAGVYTGKVEKVAPWTLQEACEALMQERVIPNATSQASSATRQNTLTKLLGILGPEVSVNEIGYREVMSLTNRLRVQLDLSPSYTNGILVGLKMALDHAWQSGRKAEAPVKIDMVKRKQGRIRFLTDGEEASVLEWFKHHGQSDMIDLTSILIDTGLRVGELLSLEWKDVNFTSHKIYVWSSKSAEPRAVVMTKQVKHHLRVRKLDADLFGGNNKVFAFTTYHKARLMWQQMKAGLGLADDREFVIHALRHTCCTRLVSAGIDLRTVQKWMGHEDIKTTMRYAHFVPENMFNAADALDQRRKPELKLVSEGDE